MFHIIQLTHADGESPPRFSIRPTAEARALGFPDVDLDAKDRNHALQLYLQKHDTKHALPHR